MQTIRVLQKEKDDSKKLKDLRNIAVFAFLMLNALFVLVIFLLQLSKDVIHIRWPLGVKSNITFDDNTGEVCTLFTN
jgi:chitin synthase